MKLKSLLIFFLSVLLMTSSAVAAEQNLFREQEGPDEEETYDFVSVPKSAANQELTYVIGGSYPASFGHFLFRLMAAPFLILWEYPRNEETDIRETYLEIVNRGTGRQWKKEGAEFKVSREYSAADKEGKPSREQAESSSYGNKGSETD